MLRYILIILYVAICIHARRGDRRVTIIYFDADQPKDNGAIGHMLKHSTEIALKYNSDPEAVRFVMLSEPSSEMNDVWMRRDQCEKVCKEVDNSNLKECMNLTEYSPKCEQERKHCEDKCQSKEKSWEKSTCKRECEDKSPCLVCSVVGTTRNEGLASCKRQCKSHASNDKKKLEECLFHRISDDQCTNEFKECKEACKDRKEKDKCVSGCRRTKRCLTCADNLNFRSRCVDSEISKLFPERCPGQWTSVLNPSDTRHEATEVFIVQAHGSLDLDGLPSVGFIDSKLRRMWSYIKKKSMEKKVLIVYMSCNADNRWKEEFEKEAEQAKLPYLKEIWWNKKLGSISKDIEEDRKKYSSLFTGKDVVKVEPPQRKKWSDKWWFNDKTGEKSIEPKHGSDWKVMSPHYEWKKVDESKKSQLILSAQQKFREKYVPKSGMRWLEKMNENTFSGVSDTSDTPHVGITFKYYGMTSIHSSRHTDQQLGSTHLRNFLEAYLKDGLTKETVEKLSIRSTKTFNANVKDGENELWRQGFLGYWLDNVSEEKLMTRIAGICKGSSSSISKKEVQSIRLAGQYLRNGEAFEDFNRKLYIAKSSSTSSLGLQYKKGQEVFELESGEEGYRFDLTDDYWKGKIWGRSELGSGYVDLSALENANKPVITCTNLEIFKSNGKCRFIKSGGEYKVDCTPPTEEKLVQYIVDKCNDNDGVASLKAEYVKHIRGQGYYLRKGSDAFLNFGRRHFVITKESKKGDGALNMYYLNLQPGDKLTEVLPGEDGIGFELEGSFIKNYAWGRKGNEVGLLNLRSYGFAKLDNSQPAITCNNLNKFDTKGKCKIQKNGKGKFEAHCGHEAKFGPSSPTNKRKGPVHGFYEACGVIKGTKTLCNSQHPVCCYLTKYERYDDTRCMNTKCSYCVHHQKNCKQRKEFNYHRKFIATAKQDGQTSNLEMKVGDKLEEVFTRKEGVAFDVKKAIFSGTTWAKNQRTNKVGLVRYKSNGSVDANVKEVGKDISNHSQTIDAKRKRLDRYIKKTQHEKEDQDLSLLPRLFPK